VKEKLQDPQPQIRIAALRVSESLFKKGDRSLTPEILLATKDADTNVVIQSILTAKQLDLPDWRAMVATIATPTAPRGIREVAGKLPPCHHPPVASP
ncbi:MAG: hypothetical protein NTX04_01490, partial [Verrucomicrobia bacterium]|nr:hypothetical protein [Verrucomicrobiota bacterium]